jgi:hypothetical protein
VVASGSEAWTAEASTSMLGACVSWERWSGGTRARSRYQTYGLASVEVAR